MRSFFWTIFLALAVFFCHDLALAQNRGTVIQITLNVTDLNKKPVKGIVLSNKAGGAQSGKTNGSGITIIELPNPPEPHAPIYLQLVSEEEIKTNKGWAIYYPYEGKAYMPYGSDPPFIEVILIKEIDLEYIKNHSSISIEGTPNKEGQRQSILSKTTKETELDSNEIVKEKSLLNVETKEKEKSFNLSQDLDDRIAGIINDALRWGRSYYAKGKYQEAAIAYRKALELKPDDIRIITELGLALTRAEDYNAAEQIYERSVSIKEKQLGPDHLDLATDHVTLASLYYRQGKYSEAEDHCKKALNIRGQLLEPDHLDLLGPLEIYASLLWKRHREHEAVEIEVHIKAIRAKYIQ